VAAPNETFILPVEKESRSEKALITPNQRRLVIECASDEFLNTRLDEAWTLPIQQKCDHPGSCGHPKRSPTRQLATRAGNIPVHFDQFSGIMLAVLLKLSRFSIPG